MLAHRPMSYVSSAFLLVALSGLPVSTGAAQESAATASDHPATAPAAVPVDAARPANRVEWPFVIPAGRVDLRELCDRVALQLGRNYLRGDLEVGSPKPGLELQVPMSIRGADELHAVFGQLAYSCGFCVVSMQSTLETYEVLNMQGPRRSEIASRATWKTADEVLQMRGCYEPVICIVTLASMSAQMASVALRPFFSQSASSAGGLIPGTAGDDHSIILSGLAPQVASAIAMLRAVDANSQRASSGLEARIEALEQRATGQGR